MRLSTSIKVACPGLVLALACLLPTSTQAQTSQAITLDPPAGWELQVHTMNSKGETLPPAPANFRRLGEATVGQQADLHTLTLRFSQTTKITHISVTGDFSVEQGGSCVEGNVYGRGTTCRMLVRFTPQGAGNRLGKLTISNTASPTPDAFGLGGYGYMPILSFIPSVINTVAGTYPSKAGLLNGAQNLTVDGGDTIWIADTGNGIIRNIDSTGVIRTLASGYTGVSGIAVDTFGEDYFDVPSAGKMYEIYDYGPVVQVSGTGTASCPASAPCTLSSEALGTPGEMSMDPYNNLFFVDNHNGAAFSTVQPTPANLIFLYDPFPYQQSPSAAMAVDAGDNLYSLWAISGVCEIVQQSLYNAENNNVAFNKIAGGHTCGFAGDGGLAGNAEIGAKIGQIAFDAAGDLYFTDTNSNRVRRIDYNTGIIRTIAGNGGPYYGGDFGMATVANVDVPTGVAVDSQGQVYIINGTTVSNAQVVRKIAATGLLSFPGVLKGSHTTLNIVVTNTGNQVMQLTNTAFTGTNAADFSVDPTTTSCVLTPGATLDSRQTCQIGFKFAPSAGGARTANFVFLDNTALNSNTIQLAGTGTLPAATFHITSPTNGASYASGTAVPFSASVTGTSPAPTGTVQFKVDGANYGSPVTISSGTASTSVTGLTTTSHTLSATYSGDSNYAAGGPISVTITVTTTAAQPANSLVTLAPISARAAATSCAPAAFAVIVSSTTNDLPTGDVRLLDGATVLATGSLVNGKVMLNGNALAMGTHNLVAHYVGDPLHLPANSSALTEVVSHPGGCMPVGRPAMPHFRLQ
jgi:hypothetical protein